MQILCQTGTEDEHRRQVADQLPQGAGELQAVEHDGRVPTDEPGITLLRQLQQWHTQCL